ncbi:MAG: hypothetical protein LLF75_06585 [Eubacteriales bacterium]|nr:hypothetical protein [Eubacteriales bacterium]
MTVSELGEQLSLTAYALPDGARKVTGGYTGDLLSWVMGRAQEGDAWITIMSNSNIVAVATLADVSCILLAEGAAPDKGVAELAAEKGVNLLGASEPAFSLGARLNKLL